MRVAGGIVLGSGRDQHGGGVMEFFAAAMPPVVEGDDPPPRLGQGLYPLRENPIYRMGRGEPMNEKDRLAAIVTRRPLVDKRQADLMVHYFEHASPHFAALFRHRRQVFACTEPEISPDMVANLAKLRYYATKFI